VEGICAVVVKMGSCVHCRDGFVYIVYIAIG